MGGINMEFSECTKPIRHICHDMCFRTMVGNNRIYCPHDDKPCQPHIDGLLKSKIITKKRYKELMEGL